MTRANQDALRRMNQQQLMRYIAVADETELLELINAGVNSAQQAAALEQLHRVRDARGSREDRFRSRIALAIAVLSLAIAAAALFVATR